MKASLTKKDLKELRYQCRMGYILPFMFFLISSIITMGDIKYISILLVVAFLISYLMNHKYYSDISNNVKTSETKCISQKEFKTDYEAGSGNMSTLPHNDEMKAFIRYDLIIDHTRYRVEKNLFESCKEGDEVLFYYAPKSKYLLGIEKIVF